MSTSSWYSCGFIFEGHVPDSVLKVPVELAEGVRIERLPAWVKAEEALSLESWSTKKRIEEAVAGFVVEYETDALDANVQKAEEKIFLAGFAVWLAQATGWSAAHLTHFQVKGNASSVRRTGACNALRVRQDDVYAVPEPHSLALAGRFLGAVLRLRRDGNVWIAIRFLTMALTERLWEPRFVLVWIVLEALFGPEDGREITYRLSHRVGMFLGSDAGERVELFRIAKEGYGMRSKVVHGGKLAGLTPERSEMLMNQAEDLVRRALEKVLLEVGLSETFDGKVREQYLDELVFRGG
jgi:hypothetical protein